MCHINKVGKNNDTNVFWNERKIPSTEPLQEEFIIDGLGDISKEFDDMKYYSL